jgi:hypothetical protein
MFEFFLQVYRILIYGNGIEKTPGIIEKRYSDFEKFNVKLRQKFPELMENIRILTIIIDTQQRCI